MMETASVPPTTAIVFGPFRLHRQQRLLTRGTESIPVGGRSLDILITLIERAGEVVSHKELMARVWPGVTVEEANLRIHIATLRKLLGERRDGARYIVNVPGRGYSFVAPVTGSSLGHVLAPTEASTAEGVRKLPPRLTHVIGRDETIGVVSAQLMIWRLVSIVGPGGMGKTTVAVSVAHALSDRFGGAVFFIDLAALTDPQLVPAMVASTLGLMMQTRDPVVSLLAFIGDKKVLLVLDNCEHVIEVVAPLVERIVSEAPQAHVLTTSREALRVDGEHVHLLYALECPPSDSSLTAEDVLKYPAVQLFMERAVASGYRSGLSDAEASAVARICRSVDGIALAIELAAGRVGSYGIQGTEELLDNRFKLLWQGRRTARPRHQTLNAMLDWSYNLLVEREKVVLRSLSVFVGDFTLQAACSVMSDGSSYDAEVVSTIVSLVAKSLISAGVINGSTYYRLLDTTRAYAADKLARHGEADRVSRQHAITYYEFLEHDEVVQSSFGERDLTAYTPLVGNVRAALGWALSNCREIRIGVQLAASAAPLFIGLSLLEECRYWCDRAIGALDDPGRGTKQEMILQEALALSSMFTIGHSDRVRMTIERGLVLAETFKDYTRQLRLLTGLNLFFTRLGDLHSALAVAERSSAVAQAAGDPAGIICAEWILGTTHHGLGNQATSQQHCERAMALAVGHATTTINSFGSDQRIRGRVNLARVLWLRGFVDQALEMARLVIDEAENQDHPVSVCTSLVFAVTVFLWSGQLAGLDSVIDQLIAYAGRHSLDPYRAAGIALKGELAIARDETEAGLDLLRIALETLNKGQYNILLTEVVCAFAEGLRRIGQFNEALLAIDDMMMRATNWGAKFNLSEMMRTRARILVSMPKPDRLTATDCLTEAIAIAQEQSALTLQLRSAVDLARLQAENGKQQLARQMLVSLYGRFTEGFETVPLRTAQQLMTELA